jgi:ABC-type glycerol-3-phosphate transport system substrate-binding protein
MLKKGNFTLLILILILAVVLASCGGGEAQPEAAEEADTGPAQTVQEEPTLEPTEVPQKTEDAITITWGMWGSPEEIETHQKVADAYMAANPNVTIELWAQPWGDYFTKLQTLWAAGDGEAIPDVLFLRPTLPMGYWKTWIPSLLPRVWT